MSEGNNVGKGNGLEALSDAASAMSRKGGKRKTPGAVDGNGGGGGRGGGGGEIRQKRQPNQEHPRPSTGTGRSIGMPPPPAPHAPGPMMPPPVHPMPPGMMHAMPGWAMGDPRAPFPPPGVVPTSPAAQAKGSSSGTSTPSPTKSVGCKCRKSHCLKHYCECFHKKKKCGPHCKCVRKKCENGNGRMPKKAPIKKGSRSKRGVMPTIRGGGGGALLPGGSNHPPPHAHFPPMMHGMTPPMMPMPQPRAAYPQQQQH
mmetsp:Transcript_7772/g.16195  ORF Transcript_7772/g.16195 Transcript_7772/m.16195 type:complete len:256 (-) Transcript_7772:23-790(-)